MRRGQPITRWEFELKSKEVQAKLTRIDREVTRSKDLITISNNLALAVSKDYSELIKDKQLEVSEFIYKCSELLKQVLHLEEQTSRVNDTVESFRIGLRTIFDRTDRLERQVEDLIWKGHSKRR